MMRFTLFLMLAVLTTAAPAAPAEDRRPVEFRIVVPDRGDVRGLADQFEITDVDGNQVTLVGPPSHIRELRSLGYTVVEVESSTVQAATMCPAGWEDLTEPSWNCYPTYDQYVALMHRLADEHPTVCRLHDLGGTANQARPHRLLTLEITDSPDVDEFEPEVFLSSTMHGDETAGFVTLLRLAWALVHGDGSDPRITDLVNETEIWINPLANPDGTYYGGDHTVGSAIRYLVTETGQIAWVNANRNFPDPRLGLHPDGRPWWPETIAMMDLAGERHFALSANLHGGAELVNYPWDTWCLRHPETPWFFQLSSDWATAAQEDGPPGAMADCKEPLCTNDPCVPGVTNGADWYTVAGGRQDFMTYFHGGREITVELSTVKLLPADQLESTWSTHRRALLRFIEASHEGISGLVLDAETGRPLDAEIELIGIDTDQARSSIRTDPAVGNFHRLVLPGRYDLRVSAVGRKPLRVPGVDVPAGGPYPELILELEPTDPVDVPSRPEGNR